VLELLHQVVDGVAVLLLLFYVGIPLLCKLCDLLAWGWRSITGKPKPEQDMDEHERILQESKDFMNGRGK